MKTWNIYLVDDGLEENHEMFTVMLKNPKNAVLGQRTSATVEIIDPRGGVTFVYFCRFSTTPKFPPSGSVLSFHSLFYSKLQKHRPWMRCPHS